MFLFSVLQWFVSFEYLIKLLAINNRKFWTKEMGNFLFQYVLEKKKFKLKKENVFSFLVVFQLKYNLVEFQIVIIFV